MKRTEMIGKLYEYIEQHENFGQMSEVAVYLGSMTDDELKIYHDEKFNS